MMIHGMVDRPLVLTMEDLKSLSYVSRIHFVECLGNCAKEHVRAPVGSCIMKATPKCLRRCYGIWTVVSLAV